jgi:hypothetical protein
VVQLYHGALCSLSVTSYDSQSYGKGSTPTSWLLTDSLNKLGTVRTENTSSYNSLLWRHMFIAAVQLPQEEDVKYLGLHLGI